MVPILDCLCPDSRVETLSPLPWGLEARPRGGDQGQEGREGGPRWGPCAVRRGVPGRGVPERTGWVWAVALSRIGTCRHLMALPAPRHPLRPTSLTQQKGFPFPLEDKPTVLRAVGPRRLPQGNEAGHVSGVWPVVNGVWRASAEDRERRGRGAWGAGRPPRPPAADPSSRGHPSRRGPRPRSRRGTNSGRVSGVGGPGGRLGRLPGASCAAVCSPKRNVVPRRAVASGPRARSARRPHGPSGKEAGPHAAGRG